MIPQETTFTIGQFAAIHGIHKKTLMWYDQVGLLSPAFVGENGYRYYSYRQSARLETILMLRLWRSPSRRSKPFCPTVPPGSCGACSREKIAGVEGQSAAWRKSATPWSGSRPPLARLETLPLTQISLVRRETCYLATVPLPGDTPTDREIAAVIDQAKAHQLGHLTKGLWRHAPRGAPAAGAVHRLHPPLPGGPRPHPPGRGCTGVPKGGIFWPITRDPGRDFPPSTRPFWPMPGTTS